ncbi:MAG TPA: cold shock domain-containing protein [Kineosporiaceae bacterium]
METDAVQGEVIRFDPVKGYGFISPRSGGEDVFLHANDLLDEKYLIKPGATVEFVIEVGERGPKASSVHLVSPSPATAPPLEERAAVLSEADFQREVTELLLHAESGLTGEQILTIRRSLSALGRRRGWIGAG